MVIYKRRDPLPRILVQGLILALLVSSAHSQWMSYRSARNPKSKLWFPNMPAPRALQQRSSVGSTIRGISSSSNSNTNSNSHSNIPPTDSRPRTRPLDHRSVSGQPGHTVQGGVLSRRETVQSHQRNAYQSSSLLQGGNANGRQAEPSQRSNQRESYASSSRLPSSGIQGQQSSNQQQHQRSQSQGQSSSNSQQQSNRNSQFSQRSGQQSQHSWNHQNSENKHPSPSPTVVSSRHLSVNLNNLGSKNRGNGQAGSGSASAGGNSGTPNSYASSRRLLEVGPGRTGEPTRRPISQTAGALQDSWPNSMTHHHLTPILKNQKINKPGGESYYESTHEQGSPWGSHVRVSDKPIEIKSFAKSASMEKTAYTDKPVDRVLSISTNGRDKMVTNTLNTLAKLSPKKPIFVYMRAEGLAAVKSGADAGEVIKKLAGSSKLPFYNGTRSLPKENMPTVFLAPDDMTPPIGYGKIPIPNLKPKEATPKPTYTKILLPGGTRMTSNLIPHTTTTTTPKPTIPTILSTAQSLFQASVQPSYFGNGNNNNTRTTASPDGLSLDQKLKILQMLKGQAEAAMNQEEAAKNQAQQNFNRGYQILHGPPPPGGESSDAYRNMFRGVLPKDAVLESISTLGNSGNSGPAGNLNHFSQFPVPDESNNNILMGPDRGGRPVLPNIQGSVAETDIQKLIGAIVDTAVSKTVGQIRPGGQQMGIGQQHSQLHQHSSHQHGNQQRNHPQQQQIHQQQQQIHQQQQQFNQQHPQQPQMQQQIHQQQHQQFVQQFMQNQQTQQNGFVQPNILNSQTNSQGQLQHAMNQALQYAQSQAMAQSKMDQGRTVFVNSTPNPTHQSHQNQPPGPPQRPRPPSSPKPSMRLNPIKNALSLLGIQSTPRPDQGRNSPTPRPFPSIFHHSQPRPGHHHNGPNHPTRGPPPPHRPPHNRADHSGSHESYEHGNNNNNKNGQTIIVQTPDRSKPNGQKSTFVITGGGGDLPELKKIMKVINELNGDSAQSTPSSHGPPQQFQPTRPPFQQQGPPPTARPTMMPYPQHPGQLVHHHQSQQPQVMIRHPAGSPTPGPMFVSTGGPEGVHFVSSTQPPQNRPMFVSPTQGPPGPTSRPMFVSSTHPPQGPTARPMFVTQTQPTQGPTGRPMFMSSTGAPIILGPRPTDPEQNFQVIKALSPPQLQLPQLHQHLLQQNQPQQKQQQRPPQLLQQTRLQQVQQQQQQIRPQPVQQQQQIRPQPVQQQQQIRPQQVQPQQQRPQQPQKPQQRPQQPQIIFETAPANLPKITNPASLQNSDLGEFLTDSNGFPRIIEIDPGANPQQIHDSIMQTIMKQHGLGGTGSAPGPIVFNTIPVESVPNLRQNVQTLGVKAQKNETIKSQGSFTVQPAIDGSPSQNPQTPTFSSESKFSKESSERVRPKPGSSESPGSRQQLSKEATEEKHRNHFSSEKIKTHHHSKEVSDEKPRNKYLSREKNRQKDDSSEEKLIEKVITEEKIVWNKGPGDGEMIPSRIKTEERIILRPHLSKSTESTKDKSSFGSGSGSGERVRLSSGERIRTSSGSSEQKQQSDESNRRSDELRKPSSEMEGQQFQNAFVMKLLNQGKPKETTEEESSKSEDKTPNAPTNFAGLLRSKLKFEKMRQHLYPTKQSSGSRFDVPESSNPFSRFLNSVQPSPTQATTTTLLTSPASSTRAATSTTAVTSTIAGSSTSDASSTSIASPEPTNEIFQSTPQIENGRFRIRPGDISNVKSDGANQGPVYGVTPTGQTVMMQSPTAPSFADSPSPSAFPSPTSPSYPSGPSAAPSQIGPSPSAYPQIGPSPSSFPYYEPSPSAYPPIGPSPSAYPSFGQSANLPNGSPSTYPSFGPSAIPPSGPSTYPAFGPSAIPPSGPSTTYSTIEQNPPTRQTIPPGTHEEKLMFIPVDSIGKDGNHVGKINAGPTIQTKNGQNQTVLFTTMNNLPDIMAQLSGTNTEVRMIQDLNAWQKALAKVQDNQATSTQTPSTYSTIQQFTTPTPTQAANRRSDTDFVDDRPMTWRPNGTVPVPTMESLRKRFPSGFGANVLHAVSAGFAASQANSRWAQHGNHQMMSEGGRPQVIYTMANGLPVALNTYQPFLLQGTKEPVLAYYGYNWNSGDPLAGASSTFAPVAQSIDFSEDNTPESGPQVKYRSRFRGSAPVVEAEENEASQKLGPVYKIKKSRIQPKQRTTTLDPIDPLSEEYDDVPEEPHKSKVRHSGEGESNKFKGQRTSLDIDEDEEPPKSSRRRRPGVLKEDLVDREEDIEPKKSSRTRQNDSESPRIRSNGRPQEVENAKESVKESSEEIEPTRESIKSTTAKTKKPTTTELTPSSTPDIMSRRNDDFEDEELPSVTPATKKPIKVNQDMFVVSGEERLEESSSSKLVANETQPTSKLPILLAPTIISSKSVVKKTGLNYDAEEPKTSPKPKSTASPSTTTQLLTTILTKMTSTKPSPTVQSTKKSKTDDDEFRETQAELKNLLKKIQEKLGRGDDVYDLGGDALYDYYEELHVPSTKATTTTTIKGTKKPTTKKSSSKSKASSKSKISKNSKSSKSKSKSKKASKKSASTTKKPKITTTTFQTTTTTTTVKPVITSTSTTTPMPTTPPITTPTTTPTTTTTTLPPQVLKNHRHPINSLEALATSIPAVPNTEEGSSSSEPSINKNQPLPVQSSTETASESNSMEPQKYYQNQPNIGSGSIETPTQFPSADPSTVSFVYPQNGQNGKDVAGSKVHYRRRPLWVRRKNPGGSGESLEPLAKPIGSTNDGKQVIRLVRRRRPGMRRRPVFIPQSIEQTSTTSTSTTPIPVTVETSTQQSTTAITLESLFENNNEISKRVGYPDSSERSQKNITARIGGKRKLKLIRLKGQRAQWRLKMNEPDSSGDDISGPQAAHLIAPRSESQPPLVSPVSMGFENHRGVEGLAQERQEYSSSSSSVEAKVCIRGKCEIISRQ